MENEENKNSNEINNFNENNNININNNVNDFNDKWKFNVSKNIRIIIERIWTKKVMKI